MKILLISFLSLFMTLHAGFVEPVDNSEELETLLHWFLEGASDYDTHNRFWANDLIYTSSAGDRIGKMISYPGCVEIAKMKAVMMKLIAETRFRSDDMVTQPYWHSG